MAKTKAETAAEVARQIVIEDNPLAPEIVLETFVGTAFGAGMAKINTGSIRFNPDGPQPRIAVTGTLAIPFPALYQIRDALTRVIEGAEAAGLVKVAEKKAAQK